MLGTPYSFGLGKLRWELFNMTEWNEIHNYKNNARTRKNCLLIGQEEFKFSTHRIFRHKVCEVTFRSKNMITDGV